MSMKITLRSEIEYVSYRVVEENKWVVNATVNILIRCLI